MECAGGYLQGSCVGPAVLRCGACGAVCYCSRKHQKAHWDEHSLVCSRMAHQMQRAPVLYDFPFTYTQHTTRLIETQETSLCLLLEWWGVHGEGLWASSCSCFQLPASLRSRGKNFDWRLPTGFCPCKDPEGSPARHLQSWEEYYNWRGISFESPAALILHWPLTVYHAVCLAQSQTFCSRPRETLLIHYLGPERELEQLPAFVELLALLPAVDIHIDFIGPAVPKSADRENHTFSAFAHCSDLECACTESGEVSNLKGRLTTTLWTGFYHDRHAGLGRNPDLIFAANAGIAAFPSWHSTLELIISLNVPAFFTDYCEEAAVLATETIGHVIGGKHPGLAFPVQVNPFRQPLSPTHKDLDLPTFSNAFVFGILGPSNVCPSQESPENHHKLVLS